MDGMPSECARCGSGAYCVQCGYDLRESPREGVCPECSLACAHSAWLWDESGDRWRRRLRAGAILLLTGPVYIVLFNVVFYVIDHILQWNWTSSHAVNWAMGALLYGLVLAGAVLATVPCPNAIRAHVHDRARRFARVLALVGAAGIVVGPLVQWWLGRIANDYWMADLYGPLAVVNGLIAILSYALGVSVLAALWMTTKYLISVASVLRAEALRRHIRFALYGSLVISVVMGLVVVALTVPLPGTGEPLTYYDPDSLGWRIYAVVAWALMVALYAWAMIVLARLALRLRRPRWVGAVAENAATNETTRHQSPLI